MGRGILGSKDLVVMGCDWLQMGSMLLGRHVLGTGWVHHYEEIPSKSPGRDIGVEGGDTRPSGKLEKQGVRLEPGSHVRCGGLGSPGWGWSNGEEPSGLAV